jgi:hypothetical protein
MKSNQLVAVLTLVASSAVHSQESLPPPAWPVPDIRPTGTKVQPVTGATVGSLHVVFEKTTFKDILGALGKAPIGQQGDAGEFLMWVCYTVPAVHARIRLTSSELGGQEFIDGMVAKQIRPGEPDNPLCPRLVGKPSGAAIDKGIWLGDSVEKIQGILGRPNTAPASVIYYSYEGKEGAFDVSSVLALKVQSKIVTEIHASHSATN